MYKDRVFNIKGKSFLTQKNFLFKHKCLGGDHGRVINKKKQLSEHPGWPK